MGEQYRRELMLQVEGSNELIKIDLKGEKKPIKVEFEGEVLAQNGMGDIYGGYGKNEMKQEDKTKNEMKNLGRIFVRIGEEQLLNIREIIMGIRKQVGDYYCAKECECMVNGDGKQVWYLKREVGK